VKIHISEVKWESITNDREYNLRETTTTYEEQGILEEQRIARERKERQESKHKPARQIMRCRCEWGARIRYAREQDRGGIGRREVKHEVIQMKSPVRKDLQNSN